MVRKSNKNIDLKILKILFENSRENFTKISRKLGYSEAAIRKRIKKLIENNIILKFTVEINYKKIGMIRSITGIDVDPEKLWNVIEELKKFENIKKIYLTSGDHTLIVDIVSKDVNELSKIHENINELEGVRRVCPATILEIIKC